MDSAPLKLHVPEQPPTRPIGPLTVAQVLAWYEENALRVDVSAEGEHERRRLWRLFAGSYGQLLCSECKPAQLLEWISAHKTAKSAWTRKRWASTLQRPFNFAARMRLIDGNPFKGLTFPEGPEGRDWTDDEYQAVLRVSPAYIRRMVVFLRWSGLRPGELRELEWTNIDLDAEAIIITKHKTAWKTKVPRRIPLNDVLIKLLTWLAEETPRRSPRIFLNAYGRAWTVHALTKRFLELRVKAGVDATVKLHGARHTFATNAVMNGVDIASLMQLLGHRRLATTQRYLHLAGKDPYLNAAMQKAVGRG